jgi:hypothetical protein
MIANKMHPTWRAGCRGMNGTSLSRNTTRNAATTQSKREGDISDAFASLSGMQFKQLDPRFATLKQNLVAGNEEALQASWNRLLASLREEIPLIREQKSKVIPEIDFSTIDSASPELRAEHKKRGVAVIRNVIPEQEVLDLKRELREYIAKNPHTKAFPPENPQVFELYWSPAQIKARSHPNLIKAQRFLMEFWKSKDPNALVSGSHPTIYADRLRMRLPGDARFALGPHVDGGSCERWEPEGYGKGRVYDEIWKGNWEAYDPWESSSRLSVSSDLYQGVGACSMFHMFQGWLSMSSTGPFEGTLLVNPLLSLATAYFLLRPFFSPKNPITVPQNSTQPFPPSYLDASNWTLDLSPSNSWLQGATPGHGQELRHALHPHLDLPNTMVHMPRVAPGDYVSWHCDSIHAVDAVHAGKSDSSGSVHPLMPAERRQRRVSRTPARSIPGGDS